MYPVPKITSSISKPFDQQLEERRVRIRVIDFGWSITGMSPMPRPPQSTKALRASAGIHGFAVHFLAFKTIGFAIRFAL